MIPSISMLSLLVRSHAAPDVWHAEQMLRQSLQIARAQRVKFFELRTAVSLARLQSGQGRRDEAFALLAPLASWFTEGGDTADLQEARQLLEDLHS
jgi:predicted ATPase